VTPDPEAAAILAALVAAALAGAPRLRSRRRRSALRECVACGRSIVFGERTCDCEVGE
jgi:MYXO-CTERM domain-containing protein